MTHVVRDYGVSGTTSGGEADAEPLLRHVATSTPITRCCHEQVELKSPCEKDSLRAALTIYGVDESGGEDREDRLAGEADEGEVERRPREPHL